MWASASGAGLGDQRPAPSGFAKIRMAGTEYGYGLLGSGMQAPVFAQAVYTVSGPALNKNFFLTMQNPLGRTRSACDHIKFTGLLRKK